MYVCAYKDAAQRAVTTMVPGNNQGSKHQTAVNTTLHISLSQVRIYSKYSK